MWKLIYQTYLEHRIGRIMYYYLVSFLVIFGGLYFYMLWEGSVGFAVVLSVFAGAKVPSASPAVTVVQAIGMILIVRYTFLGALDEIAKRPADKFSERLAVVEEKLNDLHALTFTGMLDAERRKKILTGIKAKRAANPKVVAR
jgi:hypothetical protein